MLYQKNKRLNSCSHVVVDAAVALEAEFHSATAAIAAALQVTSIAETI